MRPPTLERQASALRRQLSHQLLPPRLQQQQRHSSPLAAWAVQPSLEQIQAILAFQASMPRHLPAQLQAVPWPGMLTEGPQQQLQHLEQQPPDLGAGTCTRETRGSGLAWWPSRVREQ